MHSSFGGHKADGGCLGKSGSELVFLPCGRMTPRDRVQVEGCFLLEGLFPNAAQLVPRLLFFPIMPDLFGMSFPIFAMVAWIPISPFLPAAAAVFAIGGIIPASLLVIAALALALAIYFRTNLLLEPRGGRSKGFSTTTTSAKQRNLLAGRAPFSCLVCSSPSRPGAGFSIYSFLSIE